MINVEEKLSIILEKLKTTISHLFKGQKRQTYNKSLMLRPVFLISRARRR